MPSGLFFHTQKVENSKHNDGTYKSHPALLKAGHKVSTYLSPNYSLKAAWTSQWPIGQGFYNTKQCTIKNKFIYFHHFKAYLETCSKNTSLLESLLCITYIPNVVL